LGLKNALAFITVVKKLKRVDEARFQNMPDLNSRKISIVI